MTGEHRVKEKVWVYQGSGGWHFITIKGKDAKEIKKDYIWPRKGFGSIPVQVKVGKTSWKTSIFPDKNDSYVLPIKKEVRNKENINNADWVDVLIEVIN